MLHLPARGDWRPVLLLAATVAAILAWEAFGQWGNHTHRGSRFPAGLPLSLLLAGAALALTAAGLWGRVTTLRAMAAVFPVLLVALLFWLALVPALFTPSAY